MYVSGVCLQLSIAFTYSCCELCCELCCKLCCELSVVWVTLPSVGLFNACHGTGPIDPPPPPELQRAAFGVWREAPQRYQPCHHAVSLSIHPALAQSPSTWRSRVGARRTEQSALTSGVPHTHQPPSALQPKPGRAGLHGFAAKPYLICKLAIRSSCPL